MMIILRTNLFGFYDEAGKLKEQYIKSAVAKKRFEKWKENMKQVYNHLKKVSGTNGIETDLEKFLRDQSAARDEYALLRKNNRGFWSSDGPQGVRGVNMKTLQSEPREGSPMTRMQNWERYNTTDFYSQDVNDKFIKDAETLKSDLIKGSQEYLNLNAKIEEMGKINDLNNKTIKDLRNKDIYNKGKIMELDNSRNNWMIGTGIASILGVAGTGAGIVYGSKKNKKNKKKINKENKEKD